jgi:DHA1 family bicyclomycin/chloramphenicol resistance-like MFS transporter
MVGNFLTGRLSGTIAPVCLIRRGNWLTLACVAALAASQFAGWMTPPLLFGLMFVVSMGNGLTMPNANAGIVLAMPKAAGAASGIFVVSRRLTRRAR